MRRSLGSLAPVAVGMVAGMAVIGVGGKVLGAIVSPGNDSTGLPYTAVLERNGQPLSATVDVRCALFPQEAGGTEVYSEEHTGVVVSNGALHLLIGTGVTLSGTFESAWSPSVRELFLDVAVKGPGDAAFVGLSGRQRLASAAYALRAAPGRDFGVDGKVGVSGLPPAQGYPSAWTGGVHAPDVYAEGNVGAGPAGGPARAALDAQGNGSFGGNVTVGGTVTTAGDTTVNGVLRPNGGLAPNYDSGWFAVAQNCETHQLTLGFTGLPAITSAYYKRSNGQVLAWGLNHYGDANQTNGALIDYDENGTAYVRLPCGASAGNNVLHLGAYKTRDNSGNETIYGQTGVYFRLMAWK